MYTVGSYTATASPERRAMGWSTVEEGFGGWAESVLEKVTLSKSTIETCTKVTDCALPSEAAAVGVLVQSWADSCSVQWPHTTAVHGGACTPAPTLSRTPCLFGCPHHDGCLACFLDLHRKSRRLVAPRRSCDSSDGAGPWCRSIGQCFSCELLIFRDVICPRFRRDRVALHATRLSVMCDVSRSFQNLGEMVKFEWLYS